MTLYHYLPSKDALLDGIVERVMAQAATRPPDGPWDQALAGYARSLRAALLRHPGAVQLVATRPAVTPETLRTAERGLALLCAAGFPVGRALDTLNALTLFVVAHAASEVSTAAVNSATPRVAAVRGQPQRAGVPAPDPRRPQLGGHRRHHPVRIRHRRLPARCQADVS